MSAEVLLVFRRTGNPHDACKMRSSDTRTTTQVARKEHEGIRNLRRYNKYQRNTAKGQYTQWCWAVKVPRVRLLRSCYARSRHRDQTTWRGGSPEYLDSLRSAPPPLFLGGKAYTMNLHLSFARGTVV